MFYVNGQYYEGQWQGDMKEGEGDQIYQNG